ncbi:MAG: LysM peptidoglycan-binding domain-containing protein [Anaerolineae bacterium]|nr:LysM peptidoglycan-binding domain-containing protein [Anaerolineae bacterium]
MVSTFFRRLVPVLGVLLIAFLGVQGAYAQNDERANSIEILGTVEAMTLYTITVNGLIVDTSIAEISTPLALNQAVHVEGILLPDSIIQARQVHAAPAGLLQPGELELVGTLESLAQSQAVINGLAVSLAGAEIKNGITVGRLVRLHAFIQAGQGWVAREIEPYLPASEDSPTSGSSGSQSQEDSPELLQGRQFKIVGTLEDIGDGFVVVGGQTIDIRTAEVDDILMIGTLVKLELTLRDGQLIAREIERARSLFNDNEGSSPDNSNDNNNDNSSNRNTNSNTSASGSCVVTQPAGWTTYTIRRGDTLSAIARGAGSTISELVAANCITNTRLIRVGQQLFVPRQPTGNLTNDNNDNRDNDNWNDNNDDNNNDDNTSSNDNQGDDHNNNRNENDNDDHSDNADDD